MCFYVRNHGSQQGTLAKTSDDSENDTTTGHHNRTPLLTPKTE